MRGLPASHPLLGSCGVGLNQMFSKWSREITRTGYRIGLYSPFSNPSSRAMPICAQIGPAEGVELSLDMCWSFRPASMSTNCPCRTSCRQMKAAPAAVRVIAPRKLIRWERFREGIEYCKIALILSTAVVQAMAFHSSQVMLQHSGCCVSKCGVEVLRWPEAQGSALSTNLVASSPLESSN